MATRANEVVEYPYMSAMEIAKLLGYGRTMGYKIAKELRDELVRKGVRVPKRGLVPRQYVIDRLGGFAQVKEVV